MPNLSGTAPYTHKHSGESGAPTNTPHKRTQHRPHTLTISSPFDERTAGNPTEKSHFPANDVMPDVYILANIERAVSRENTVEPVVGHTPAPAIVPAMTESELISASSACD
jgi:hypothetical protein